MNIFRWTKSGCRRGVGVCLLGLSVFSAACGPGGAAPPAAGAFDARGVELHRQIAELERGPSTPETNAQRSRLQAELLHHVAPLLLNQGRGDIQGMMVDEEGNALGGVELIVTKRTAVGFGKYKEEKERRILNGPFELRLSGLTDAMLSFRRDGYYDYGMFLPLGSPQSVAEHLAPYLAADGTLKFPMFRRGALARLQIVTIELEFSDNGAATVADLSMLKKGEITAPMELAGRAGPDAPRVGLWFTIDRDASGAFLANPAHQKLPAMLRIHVAGDDTGIAPATRIPDQRLDVSFRRAPEEGYRQELAFTGEQLRSLAAFYVRLGGLYGRGRIDLSETLRPGRKVLKAKLELEMQMDGSRSLETEGRLH